MNLLPRKAIVTPSLDERALNASIEADVALNVFSVAAQTLEASAIELEDIASEAAAEMARLSHLSTTTEGEARNRRAQASAIRNLAAGNLGAAL